MDKRLVLKPTWSAVANATRIMYEKFGAVVCVNLPDAAIIGNANSIEDLLNKIEGQVMPVFSSICPSLEYGNINLSIQGLIIRNEIGNLEVVIKDTDTNWDNLETELRAAGLTLVI